MPEFRLQGLQATGTFVDGAPSASGFLPNGTGVALASEADRQHKDYGAHTYRDLYANVTTHTGAFNIAIALTENGTASTNLTMTATATGIIRDVTGTEAATANDLIACEHISDGMHGDDHAVEDTGITASGGVAGITGYGNVTVLATAFTGLWNQQTDTTFLDIATRLSRDATFNNLRVVITANSSTWSTAPYDGTDASTNVVVTSSGTGAAEDITGTEAYTSGEDVGLRFNEDVGGSFTPALVQMDSDVDEMPRGGGMNFETIGTTDEFFTLAIGLPQGIGTDTSGVTKHDTRIGVLDIANLHARIAAVSSPTSPRLGPKLNASAVSTNVVVAPSSTGLVSDETGVETLAEDDELGGFGDTASGTFTVDSFYIEMPSTSTGASVTISGVVAEADAASPLATITSVGMISVAGEPATAPAAALLPAIEIGITIAGEPATSPAVAELATISTIEIISVAGEVAAAPAVAELPTITSSQILSVAGEPATADADVLLAAVEIGVTIAGVVAEAPAVAELATITAVTDAVISGETATAPAAVPLATVSTVQIVLIAGEPATAPAVAELPTTTSVGIVSIAGESATADADALLATITAASGAITVSPPAITATAAALLPTITTVRIVSITGVVAEAPATALIPAVEIATTIAGEPATAPAVAELPTITSVGIVSIAGEAATAPAAALLATITTVRFVSIAGETATAPASAPLATVTSVGVVSVAGETAAAPAAAPLATITSVRVVAVAGKVATADAVALLATITASAGGVSVTITGVVAQAPAVAEVPTITAGIAITVNGVLATAPAAALLPSIASLEVVLVAAVLATSVAEGLIPRLIVPGRVPAGRVVRLARYRWR